MENNHVEGRRAVAEALRSGRPTDRLYVQSGAKGLGELIRAAKENGAVVVERDRHFLDRLSQTGTHQGVIATMAAFAYSEMEDVLARAAGGDLFLIVCDGVQDERNLGAVIRTAEVVGAHGVVIPKRRSAGLSAVTARAAAGAAEHIPIVRVPGVPSFLRELKASGVWIYGAAGDAAENAFDAEFTFPAALVLGSEETGLHRLTRELCDKLTALPMSGKTGSLNVSCAAAVLMYRMKYGR
ncbi:MAG: 23S rRNA (guanosine(2251)-2'-O)-methyltransferase RlmB [Oscillospiraceae bacterium]|nr:23S rRNA (guanosine(2251)-2'-O)-methyltransferase RlmB [Oscillospiraceae bacterium]